MLYNLLGYQVFEEHKLRHNLNEQALLSYFNNIFQNEDELSILIFIFILTFIIVFHFLICL